MIYFLGTLGFVQALFLPGLCITTHFKKWNWTQRILFAVPLSLMLNYYLAWVLVTLGIYSQTTVFSVGIVEVICIAYRIHRNKPSVNTYLPVDRPSELIFLLVAVAALTKYAQAWIRSFGEVFTMWDAVVSWNAWGRDWFHGVIPSSGLYPHALPITNSLPYIFMGSSEIETFSKATMGMVYLCGLGALVELGFRRKDIRSLAWACAFIYPAIQSHFLQSHWNTGYADVPLAVMLLFAFCVSFFQGRESIWLVGFFAGTAALVKQPGLLFTSLSPILAKGVRFFRKNIWQTALAASIAAGPWYFYIFTKIAQGKANQNTSYLANLVHGGLVDRWSVTFNLLLYFASPAYLITCVGLATIGSITSREARRWWLLLGLPYFLIWGTLFSYDIRNLSMSLFPLALAVSAGAAYLLQYFENFLKLPSQFPNITALRSPVFLGRSVLILTVLLVFAAAPKAISKWKEFGSLEGWENEQRRYLGDAPKANQIFTELASCRAGTTNLLTNYWWATVLPSLKDKIESVDCARIREALVKKEPAYVYLHKPTCDLQGFSPITVYEEEGFLLFATNPAQPTTCARK